MAESQETRRFTVRRGLTHHERLPTRGGGPHRPLRGQVAVSRFPRRSERRDDRRDVVAPSTVERELQESLADFARGQSAAKCGGEGVIIDAVGEPVAAEQQAIAILDAQQIDVHVDVPAAPAERVDQDVTAIREGDVTGR